MRNDEILFLKKISEKKNLKLISFHAATNCDNPVLKSGMFYSGGRDYSYLQLLDNAKRNIRLIRAIFGLDVLIAVENNNYYPTEAYRYVAEPDFLSRLVRENGIWFVYDIAHGMITAYNKRIDYSQYRSRLPMGRLVQIHLSGWGLKRKALAFDKHSVPTNREMLEFMDLLQFLSVKYVTVEYYRNVQRLLKIMGRIREII